MKIGKWKMQVVSLLTLMGLILSPGFFGGSTCEAFDRSDCTG